MLFKKIWCCICSRRIYWFQHRVELYSPKGLAHIRCAGQHLIRELVAKGFVSAARQLSELLCRIS